MVKRKACVFISGSGTNLRSIIKNSRDYNFPIRICLVISNNKNAKGLNFAKKFSIPHLILENKIDKFEKNAIRELSKRKIKLLCLAGFMRILSKRFIRQFKGQIINVHPSLLPKFKGLNTFERVIKSKEKFTGCTVHFVDEKLDNGKKIIQKRILIEKGDNVEILKRKVQKNEYQAYSFAIRKIYS